MKAKVDGRAFRPVQLTIESAEELCLLWHYLNVPSSRVEEYAERDSNNVVPWPNAEGTALEMWETVNNVCIEMGVRSYD